MTALSLHAVIMRRPLVRPFIIATGARTDQPVLSVRLRDGALVGRGEATGVAYLGETSERLMAQIEALRDAVEPGLTREALIERMAPGGVRAAVDAALWELEAARAQTTVAALLGVVPAPIESAFTIVLDSPAAMAAQTQAEAWRPFLKVKLGGNASDEAARLRAVAQAAGTAKRVIDANAGWHAEQLIALAPLATSLGYELLEQPLPAGSETDPEARAALQQAATHIPLCADESLQTLDDLHAVEGLYQAVNIKLDKCGGLTSALRIKTVAREKGLRIFVGCMLAPTVAIAPAHLLAQDADYVDLDGPFWFHDEPARLTADGRFAPIPPQVWGQGRIDER